MIEEEIQRTFVDWHSRAHQYREEFTDPNGGAGALVDSAGFVGQVPQLIEFKVSIKDSGVTYESNKVSSIERKIRDSIERLHQDRLLKTKWNRRSLPLVWIIAGEITSSGEDGLKGLLESRSSEWCFTYKVGLWDGRACKDLSAGPKANPVLKPLRDLNLPPMPSAPVFRNPPRGLSEQREVAHQRGVQQLFEFAVQEVQRASLIMQNNRDSIMLRTSSTNVGAIWPVDSSRQKGLCIAAQFDRLQNRFGVVINASSLPGVEAPSRGFLGPRRFLRTKDEITRFFEAITRRQ
jgi:hypothetical protein